MLGEVVECVLVVLKNDAVTLAVVNIGHAHNDAVVQVEGEHVRGGYVDEEEATSGNDVVMQYHATRGAFTAE